MTAKRDREAARPVGLTAQQALWLELMQFYIREAWLLDERKLEEWLDLFTADVLYFMPRRKNVSRREAHRELTPVGDLATLAVINQDLNHIVVKASRDVTFHYFVQGVRRAFKDVEPVRIGYEFMPRSPEETIPLYLSEEARRRLIANGTYNPDGTVNMETAERAGWTKIWADRQAAMEAARRASQQKAVPAGFNKP